MPAQGSHSRRPESGGNFMEKGQLPRQHHCETPHQDSDELPREQSCPGGESKDSVEVDEPKWPGQPAKPTAYVNPMMCETSELAERHDSRNNQAAEHHARRNDQSAERHARRSDQSAERHARRSDQAAEHHARRSDQAAERHARRSEQTGERHARRSYQAAERHARRSDQVQRAYSERQRQRTERCKHLQAAFQEWPETYLYDYRGPYLYTQDELNLYTPFTPTGPVFVQMVQQPPMVYRYWAGMEYWISVSYPCQVFIPLASTGSYFVRPSFMTYMFRTTWFLTYNAQ